MVALSSLGLLLTPFQVPEPVSYAAAKGPVQWRLEDPQIPWAKEVLTQIKLDNCRLECVLNIQENKVEAWDANGDPANDFAGFIKTLLRLKTLGTPSFQPLKKNRIAVIETPSQNFPTGDGGSVYASSVSNLGGIQDWEYKFNEGETQFKYIPLVAQQGHGYASVPLALYWHAISVSIAAEKGKHFKLLGSEFVLTNVQPFAGKDASALSANKTHKQLRTTITVKRVATKFKFVPEGQPEPPLLPSGMPPQYGWSLDAKGNFKKHERRSMNDLSYQWPDSELHFLSEDKASGIIKFATSVNIKSVKILDFGLSYEFRAWLDNIPLDPKGD